MNLAVSRRDRHPAAPDRRPSAGPDPTNPPDWRLHLSKKSVSATFFAPHLMHPRHRLRQRHTRRRTSLVAAISAAATRSVGRVSMPAGRGEARVCFARRSWTLSSSRFCTRCPGHIQQSFFGLEATPCPWSAGRPEGTATASSGRWCTGSVRQSLRCHGAGRPRWGAARFRALWGSRGSCR